MKAKCFKADWHALEARSGFRTLLEKYDESDMQNAKHILQVRGSHGVSMDVHSSHSPRVAYQEGYDVVMQVALGAYATARYDLILLPAGVRFLRRPGHLRAWRNGTERVPPVLQKRRRGRRGSARAASEGTGHDIHGVFAPKRVMSWYALDHNRCCLTELLCAGVQHRRP